MAISTPPTITNAPSPAPTRNDPANFNTRADAYHSWLPNFINVELQNLITYLNNQQYYRGTFDDNRIVTSADYTMTQDQIGSCVWQQLGTNLTLPTPKKNGDFIRVVKNHAVLDFNTKILGTFHFPGNAAPSEVVLEFGAESVDLVAIDDVWSIVGGSYLERMLKSSLGVNCKFDGDVTTLASAGTYLLTPTATSVPRSEYWLLDLKCERFGAYARKFVLKHTSSDETYYRTINSNSTVDTGWVRQLNFRDHGNNKSMIGCASNITINPDHAGRTLLLWLDGITFSLPNPNTMMSGDKITIYPLGRTATLQCVTANIVSATGAFSATSVLALPSNKVNFLETDGSTWIISQILA